MTTNNSWNSQDPAQVAKGGTGLASATAYAVLCGGTTSTNPLQSIAGVGTSGQVLTSNGAGALPTFQTVSSSSPWTLGTPQATTSGTTVLFSSLPAGIRVIKFIFDQVSSTGTNSFQLLLGDSGGLEATGYSGNAWAQGGGSAWSTAATVMVSTGAANNYSGIVELVLYDSPNNSWAFSGTLNPHTTSNSSFCGGVKSLSDTLTQIQLKLSGADNFDNGQVNILYS